MTPLPPRTRCSSVNAIYMRCEKRKIVRGAAIQSKREIQDPGKMPGCKRFQWEPGRQRPQPVENSND